MSREKQIEEMAKVIDEYTEPLSARDIHKADFSEKFAEHLYNAGYRKQSEGVTDINVGNKAEWISVDERLPDPDHPVLMFTRKNSYYVGGYYKAVVDPKYTGFYADSVKRDVTHWMPLPEPPKMKGGANNG